VKYTTMEAHRNVHVYKFGIKKTTNKNVYQRIFYLV